jgi:hypothetical protein
VSAPELLVDAALTQHGQTQPAVLGRNGQAEQADVSSTFQQFIRDTVVNLDLMGAWQHLAIDKLANERRKPLEHRFGHGCRWLHADFSGSWFERGRPADAQDDFAEPSEYRHDHVARTETHNARERTTQNHVAKLERDAQALRLLVKSGAVMPAARKRPPRRARSADVPASSRPKYSGTVRPSSSAIAYRIARPVCWKPRV